MGPLIAVWALTTIISWAIGAGKGNSAGGFFLGALLGPLGILITALLKPTVQIQAQRDIALEAERERLRQQANVGTDGEPPRAPA
jgi:hypothetical protein